MKKEDIRHLGMLSRIKLTDDEVESFGAEIDSILEYVSVVKKIASDGDVIKKIGPIYNVFRDDVVTNETGEYTERILREAPQTKRGYIQVKKILNQDM